jgi:O-antigen ligase
MWLLVNSASRISFVSLLIAETFALFLARKSKMIPVVLGISVLFIGISSNLLNRYSRFLNVYTERIKESISLNFNTVYAASDTQGEDLFKREKVTPTPTPVPVFEDRSTSIRLNVEWPRAIRSFYKNPLLGTGFASIDLATDNDYLRILGETGLLGLYTFGLFWVNIFIIFIKNFKKIKKFGVMGLALICGFAGAMPGILVNAMFIDIFEASKFAIIFWFVCGLFVSTLYNSNKKALYDK